MATNHTTPVPDDEISLKDILAEIKLWVKLAQNNLFTLVLLGVLGGALGFAYAWFSKPQYSAKLTFVIKRNDIGSASASLSGLSSLLGMGSNSAGNSLDRVIELAGTENIVGNALLQPAEVDGKSDLLINQYIRLAELKEAWKEDTLLSKVSFPARVTYQSLSYAQRKAFKQVVSEIVGSAENGTSGILTKEFDKNSAIIKLAVKYSNQDFAIALTRGVYTQLLNFYTREAIASTSSNVAILKNKVDSIRNALYATQKSAAQKSDQALGLILQEDRVDQKSLAVKENMLTLMYGEAQKNLETLSFMQYTTRPIFTIIDEPFAPIKPGVKNKLLFLLLGLFVAIASCLSFLRLKHWLTKIAA
ncbi:MAG: hypothetical protein ACKOWL_01620 [Sphingobacteriaceae bacterium]